MKILYLRYYDDGNMTLWQDVNFINELELSGVEFDIINVKGPTENVLNICKAKLGKYKYDLFFTSCDDRILSSDLIKCIKSYSLPTLLICFDNLSVPYKHKRCCSYFDLVWLTSIETESMFTNWGATTIFLPYAANPYVYKPTDNGSIISGVSFVGSCYGGRHQKIEHIIESGYQVNLFGGNTVGNEQGNPINNALANLKESLFKVYQLSKFNIGRACIKSAIIKSFSGNELFSQGFTDAESARKRLSFEELVDVYSRSQLSLGVSELWNTYLLKEPIHKIHLRTFEVPMSGGLLLTSRTNEMECYFDDKREVLLYESKDEMLDLIKYYTKPKYAKQVNDMKHNSSIRARECHTWTNRFNEIFDRLDLGKI